jgi:hypothetical protein
MEAIGIMLGFAVAMTVYFTFGWWMMDLRRVNRWLSGDPDWREPYRRRRRRRP